MVKEGKSVDSTEEKIVDSAMEVFVEKGFDGARMQEIADKAGVNKALLNYYFRSKERLFRATARIIFQPMIDNMYETLDQEGDIFQMAEKLIRRHFRFIRSHSQVPIFLAKELSSLRGGIRGEIADVFISEIKNSGIPQKLVGRIKDAVDKGLIRPVDPINLLLSILSMNIMYILIRPIYSDVFAAQIEDIDEFEKNRENEIVNLVISSLKNKNFINIAGVDQYE